MLIPQPLIIPACRLQILSVLRSPHERKVPRRLPVRNPAALDPGAFGPKIVVVPVVVMVITKPGLEAVHAIKTKAVEVLFRTIDGALDDCLITLMA